MRVTSSDADLVGLNNLR